MPEQKTIKYPYQQASIISSKPPIAGILLMISGVIALFSWIYWILIKDVATTLSPTYMSLLQEVSPTITSEQIWQTILLIGVMFCILAIFTIMGGVLALKRKMWKTALLGSIIGLFTTGLFYISSILSLIGLILVAISKKEFQ